MRAAPLAAIALLACAMTPAGADTPADRVTVVLKFVKQGSPARPVARFVAASCPACAPDTTPLYNAENPHETVIALTVPRRRSLELAFEGPAGGVRRVVLEGGDIPFRQDAGRVVVQLPPVADEAITAAEFATHIVEPGMVLRFEHANPARRAGDYATGPFPEVQRRAADALEFAQREVIRTLGLGELVAREGLGTIQVMGFDTNAPHAHRDWPPHVHMHLRWPQNTGTQIGHFYIGPDGLLTHNQANVKGIDGKGRRYERGETFTSIAPTGAGAYTHRITPEGWLEIGRPDSLPCLIRPAGDGGFQSGALVACPGQATQRITVADDLARGVLTVTTGTIVETFRYDRDTGALLSPDRVPPPGPSVHVAPVPEPVTGR